MPNTSRKSSPVPPKKTAVKKPVASARKPATPAPRPVQDLQTLARKVRAAAAGQYVHVLQVPYEARLIASNAGAKWDNTVRQHLYLGPNLPVSLMPYVAPAHSLESWIQNEINGWEQAPTDPGTMTPRPHQLKAINKIKAAATGGWRGFVLADEVGVGKTGSALIGANEAAKARGFTPSNPAKLLILCPKSVIPHWRESIVNFGKYTRNLRIMILNYDQSLRLLTVPPKAQEAKRRSTKNRNTASGGSPTILWDIVIGDEVHRLKNESQRSAAWDRITRASFEAKSAPFVIYASATIGQNPLELRYMASLYGQLVKRKNLTSKSWGDYLIEKGYHVSKSKSGNYSWLKTRSDMDLAAKREIVQLQHADVDRMAAMLFAHGAPAIRRVPEDIAGWPEIQRIAFPVELDSNAKRLYRDAWLEFRRGLDLLPKGRNPKSQLTVQLRFQQKASLLLVPTTADYVEDLVEQGYQVAVSTQFIETIDSLREALAARKIASAEFSGRRPDREDERLRFQKGQVPVIMFTVTEGISLHANQQLPDGTKATPNPRATIIQDTYYSGIQSKQVEGRTHRDGEKSNAYYMYAEGTVQKPILDIMLQRLNNMRRLSGDEVEDTEVLEEISQLLASYEEPTEG